jgi:hypothetical protein
MMPSSTTEIPTAILAGCGRSGSTSLFQMLVASPQIAQSKLKEPGYFLGSYYGEDPPRSDYDDIFSRVPGASLRLEATAAYFYSVPEVPDLIARRVPDVRIILIFREPHARLISEFNYLKTRFLIDADLTLEAYVDKCMTMTDASFRKRSNMHLLGVRNGFYDRFFPYWSSRFGEQIKVVFHDDLAADPDGVLLSLTECLNLQPIILPVADIENQGRSFRLAGLQRRALSINARLEPFFRRHPALKATLRRAYYGVNGASHDTVRPLPDGHPLRRAYEQSLRDFRVQLHEWDHTLRLPVWLAG